MDLLTAFAAECARTRVVLLGADADAPVPTCPDWTVADLVAHLAEVRALWSGTVAARRSEPPSAPDPEPTVTVTVTTRTGRIDLDALDAATARLGTALAGTPPDTPVWSWSDRGGTAAWVRRRMAHEALVHRLDAEAAVAVRSPVDPAALHAWMWGRGEEGALVLSGDRALAASLRSLVADATG